MFEPPNIPRPTTLRGWLSAGTWAIRWSIHSARLPYPCARRRYARTTLWLAALTGLIVAVVAPIAGQLVIDLIAR